MPFVKGQSGNKAGMKPGTLHKTTRSAKEAFQAAFDKMGGMEGLVKWANKPGTDNLSSFYSLYARLIPHEVAGEIKARITVSDDIPAK